MQRGAASRTAARCRGLWRGLDDAEWQLKGLPVVRGSPQKVQHWADDQTLKELPQPQVLFMFGLLNLKPAPSIVSI